MKARTQFSTLSLQQRNLFLSPHLNLQKTLNSIYKKNNRVIGWPSNQPRRSAHLLRKNTCSIVGVALGDEGKGRLVDNKVESYLKQKNIEKVFVVRYQGGNNAGHTVEKDSIKIALHLIPSFVLHEKAYGIMDREMIVHAEDLKSEVELIEKQVGSLKKRLFLSDDAILGTDLERAEEVLNREKTGRAKGGTGRGISPGYAHALDRLGLKIYDLLSSDWKDTLSKYYDRYDKEFSVYGHKLSDIEVPDFYLTQKNKKNTKRLLGNKKVFLQHLEEARAWILKRKMITNTFLLHKELFSDKKTAILFEGAQATGLDSSIGTHPDITSSCTTCYGIIGGTAFWLPYMIEERIGVFKITYTSSVGERKMPTHIDLPKNLADLPFSPSDDQKWGAYVREEANEYGTTTGRPRDITFLDLAFISYNAVMSGIEELAGTHLDIAEEESVIKVCTHYTDKSGNYVPYQPGLRYQKNIFPHYVELPGWDGKQCTKAKSLQELPANALKFLSFIQAQTGFPITIVTTGRERKNIIKVPSLPNSSLQDL